MDPHWRSRLLNIHGIPRESIPFQRVPLNGLPGTPVGDVDILLSVPGRPELATAIQVKRVKVGAAALRDQRPNKLQEFKKGVRQANLLAKIGFSLVYLYVFVVVDSREINAGRSLYKGLTKELRSLIERAISPHGLHVRVGLMYHEFVQPMDNVPLGTGTYFGHLVRSARPISQPAEVTSWVAQATSVAAS